ncbi:exophilin 5, partial [Mus musculus]
MREESGMPPPWDASLLESEFFQGKPVHQRSLVTPGTREANTNCG